MRRNRQNFTPFIGRDSDMVRDSHEQAEIYKAFPLRVIKIHTRVRCDLCESADEPATLA